MPSTQLPWHPEFSGGFNKNFRVGKKKVPSSSVFFFLPINLLQDSTDKKPWVEFETTSLQNLVGGSIIFRWASGGESNLDGLLLTLLGIPEKERDWLRLLIENLPNMRLSSEQKRWPKCEVMLYQPWLHHGYSTNLPLTYPPPQK